MATISCAAPSPYVEHVVAPALAPAVVTAQSSQVVARNYNTLAAPLIAAAPAVPVAAPFRVASPYVAAPAVAAPAIAARYVSAPAIASPYVAAPAVNAPYVAAPAIAANYFGAPAYYV